MEATIVTRRCGLAVFFLLLVQLADASPAYSSHIDTLLESLAGSHEPGLAVGVWQHNKVLYRGVRGMASLEQHTPLTNDTLFHLASLSKALTAFAVMQLIVSGRIDPAADIHRYLPELPDFGAIVTVAQLLHMSSGIKDYFVLARLAGWDWADVLTQERIWRLITNVPTLDFAPGSTFVYCNSNYALLATIAARVSGEPFRQLMQQKVFAPLGMSRSFIQDDLEEVIAGRAESYHRTVPGAPWHRTILSFGIYGATSAYSSLNDMLTWGAALVSVQLGGRALIEQLSEPATFTSGKPNFYGSGLFHGSWSDLKTIEHGGADASFRHHLMYLPEKDLGVVVLANRELDSRAVAKRILTIMLGKRDVSRPPSEASVKVESPAEFSGAFAGGTSDGAILITPSTKGFDVRSSSDAFGVAEGGDVAAVPVGPDSIALTQYNVRLNLVRDGNGKVIGIEEYNASNLAYPYSVFRRKLEAPRYSAADLERFAGIYRSSQLDKSYQISVQEGSLAVGEITLPGAQKLLAVDRDRFELWDEVFRTFEFRRQGSAIVALRISADRATGICFIKLRSPDDVAIASPGC